MGEQWWENSGGGAVVGEQWWRSSGGGAVVEEQLWGSSGGGAVVGEQWLGAGRIRERSRDDDDGRELIRSELTEWQALV